MQCKLNQQLNDEHKGIIIEVKVLATMFTFDYNMGAYLADAYDSGGEKSQQERLAFQRKWVWIFHVVVCPKHAYGEKSLPRGRQGDEKKKEGEMFADGNYLHS